MDVENRIREGVAEGWTEPAHEAGEADEPDTADRERGGDSPIERIARRVIGVRDDESLDALRARVLEPRGAGDVRHDDPNLGRQPRLDERTQITAAPRDENG